MILRQLIALLLLALIACTNANNKHITEGSSQSLEEKRIEVDPSNSKTIKSSELYKDINYIKLATNDSSLLGRVSKVKITSNRIFVKSAKELVVFDRNGAYLYKINRFGEGPGEYASFIDYWVDENDQIIDILDGKIGKTLSFDWDGNFLGEEIHQLKSLAISRWDKDSYFVYIGNEINEVTNHQLNYLQNNKIVWGAFPIDLNEAEYLYFSEKNFHYSESDKHLSFLYSTNDTIYEVNSHGVRPRIIIDFGAYKIPQEAFQKKHESIADFIFYIRDKNYAYGYNSFNETPNQIVFSFIFGKTPYLVFHSKISNETKVVSAISDDPLFPGTTQTVTFGQFPVASYENSLFFLMQTYDLVSKLDSLKSTMPTEEWEVYSKENSSLIGLYHSSDVNDNPILLEYVLRDF